MNVNTLKKKKERKERKRRKKEKKRKRKGKRKKEKGKEKKRKKDKRQKRNLIFKILQHIRLVSMNSHLSAVEVQVPINFKSLNTQFNIGYCKDLLKFFGL